MHWQQITDALMGGLNRPALQPGQEAMVRSVLERFLQAGLDPGIAMAATVNAVAGGYTSMPIQNIDAAIRKVQGPQGQRLRHEASFPDRSLFDLIQVFREDIESPPTRGQPGLNRSGNQAHMKLARVIWPTWVMQPVRAYPGGSSPRRASAVSSRLSS